MYKKKKQNKNKLLIILPIVIVIALILSLTLNRKYTFIESILKDTSSIINKMLIYPITSFNSEKNIDQTKSYLIQKNVNTSLEKEIEELKKILELNKTLTEYSIENATILSRNKSYWFNTMTIDKGKKSGIKEDMAVVTKDGLIGKISKVSNYSSEIKLITSDDVNYKVSVAIKNDENENYAILNGYDNKTGLLKVIDVDKTTKVKKGDEILTSGLGRLFPSGIYIGTVEKIESDKYNLSKTLYIKTSQDFNNIHYVTVLKEKIK